MKRDRIDYDRANQIANEIVQAIHNDLNQDNVVVLGNSWDTLREIISWWLQSEGMQI